MLALGGFLIQIQELKLFLARFKDREDTKRFKVVSSQ